MRGKVYLVGAGPGDPELLTLKAARLIAEADVVLYDDLVNRLVLSHARSTARLIEVGKRGGCRSTPQQFIERLMLRFARAGANLVRLKGGDPFVFGRGGEEMQHLRAAGIEVEVVPGITSGLSAAASIGIPATHRDNCHGVTLVTGHTRDGVEPNWQALAQSGTTLVIYMAMRRLDAICAKLVAAGLAVDTPAAAIQNGSLPNQNHVITTLADLVRDVAAARLASPGIVVIGDVVRHAQAAKHYASIQVA